MKKSVFRQLYAKGEDNVTVVIGKVEEVKEPETIVEEEEIKIEKKEAKKKNGRKFSI